MFTTNGEATAVNTLVTFLFPPRLDAPAVSETDALAALVQLADAACKRLECGVNGEQVRKLWASTRHQWAGGNSTEDEPACRICGCTTNAPCLGGCFWVPDPQMGELCSACASAIVWPVAEINRPASPTGCTCSEFGQCPACGGPRPGQPQAVLVEAIDG